jgi:tRNA 2-thiouridine synthesizing protein A
MAFTGFSSLATEPSLIDARGLKCPLPVLRMEKWLASAQVGAQVTILATDPMAKIDIPLFCRQNGHAYALDEADNVLSFAITKA